MGEVITQPKQSTSMQLRDTGLRDAENTRDLSERESFQVIQREDQAIAFRQIAHRYLHVLTHRVVAHAFERINQSRISKLDTIRPLLACEDLLKGDHMPGRYICPCLFDLRESPARVRRELLIRGMAPETFPECGFGIGKCACPSPHRPWHPVHGTQFVDDGTADARQCVCRKCPPASRLESIHGFKESTHTSGHQIGVIHLRWKARSKTPGRVLHQRRVMQDQAFT